MPAKLTRRALDNAHRQIRSLVDAAGYAYAAAGALTDANPADGEVIAMRRSLLETSERSLLKAKCLVGAFGVEEDWSQRIDTDLRETAQVRRMAS